MVDEVHQLFHKCPRFLFPFAERMRELPSNGLYILFEKGEKYLEFDRIVRVGTHTGNNQLIARLKQHFVKDNKNRSIFRKNIGRCLLNKENHPYLKFWELDITSRKDKEKNLKLLDGDFEKELERKISVYIQKNFSFCVVEVNEKEERLFWESRIISTLSTGTVLKPSPSWLGNHSTKEKIRTFGLWQVNELRKECISEKEWNSFQSLVKIKL